MFAESIVGDVGSKRSSRRNRQRGMLELRKMAAIGRMASSISHDMRHSLSIMYANIEFLQHTNLPSAAKQEILVDLQEAVTFMVRQTDSLLQFARTGQERPPSRTALSQIIESAICAVKKHPDVRSISIAARTRTAIEVVVDAPSLERAVYNLILNACQAAMDSDHKPSVNIYLSEERGRIFVKIVDNGPGIPDCIRETLFDPFVTKNKHNGLGLALASDTAKAHGGSIYVEESVRGRTVFTLTFPGERPGDLQLAGAITIIKTIPGTIVRRSNV
jgi:signal transduction histidine kinase